MKAMRSCLAVTLAALTLLTRTSHGADPKPWVALFNDESLAGWDTYLGPAYDAKAIRVHRARLGLLHGKCARGKSDRDERGESEKPDARAAFLSCKG
jgi:hypothetical protein